MEITCKTNRELHIERAHYVAVIHRQAYHLNFMLDDPRNHRTDGNLVWGNNCYPEDITQFVFDKDEENNDHSDFEASSDFENEVEDDIDFDSYLY